MSRRRPLGDEQQPEPVAHPQLGGHEGPVLGHRSDGYIGVDGHGRIFIHVPAGCRRTDVQPDDVPAREPGSLPGRSPLRAIQAIIYDLPLVLTHPVRVVPPRPRFVGACSKAQRHGAHIRVVGRRPDIVAHVRIHQLQKITGVGLQGHRARRRIRPNGVEVLADLLLGRAPLLDDPGLGLAKGRELRARRRPTPFRVKRQQQAILTGPVRRRILKLDRDDSQLKPAAPAARPLS